MPYGGLRRERNAWTWRGRAAGLQDMDILVLGGTVWLGRTYAAHALERGHRVSCLARGESGDVAAGTELVKADRTRPDAYDAVKHRDWDAVLDVTRQPGMARGAAGALEGRVGHATFVSTGNVYAAFDELGADETAPLREPALEDQVNPEMYGEGKVACEQAWAANGAPLLIARAGLIGGPGDHTDRSGAWVARAARSPRERMLVPKTQLATQIVDVRDLVDWLLRCAENGTTGTCDAVGPWQPLTDWIALSRQVGGHTGPVAVAEPDWLQEKGVEEFMGPGSLALWQADPAYVGFCARSGARALRAGLTHRPRTDLLADVLAWEREQGLDRERSAGLSPARERELLERW